MKKAPILATVALVALAVHDPAAAADPAVAVKAPAKPPTYDWDGFYVGGHVAYGPGHTRHTVWDPAPIMGTNSFGGLMAGLHAGYNYVLPSRILLGVEGDISVPNFLESNAVLASVPRPDGDLIQQLDYVGTVRGRAGYVFEPWMVYATGGFAFAGSRILNPLPSGDAEKALRVRPGWVVGGGAEYGFAPHWTLQFQYLYSRYGSAEAAFPSGTRYAGAMDLHELRLGLNRNLDWSSGPTAPAGPQAITELPNWEMHGQTTYIQQAHPAFRSSYFGTNSLTPWAETRNTWSSSLFLGFRLWNGGELYYNPELLQGFGFNDTVGLAGFSNGEAQKSNFPYPRYSTSRLFLRHTFGFGGEQETLESAPNQLAGKVDVSRLTIQAGRFAVMDMFDGNSYAKDTRKDFMNWAIWAPGAFDYSADKIGLSYGATAEFNQKSWALRAGYFLMDKESNSSDFDTKVFQRGEYVLELEERFSLFSRPGKLRAIAWLNSVFAGSYRETLDNPVLNLDIAQTRRSRIKYGYVFNLEQSVADDIGVFGRWSWNDGRNEIMAFTDIDQSLSFGTSIKGTSWGRTNDTVGIGAAINSLSRDHRDFIAAGGLGILIGDGRLNYRTERILETYYSIAVFDAMSLTFDYQFIANPAYNADRGPVSVFSGRLHAEF